VLAIDTNVLVRVLVRDEPAQTRAADAAIAQGAWVSTLVLTETIWVLLSYYKMPAGIVAEAVRMLTRHESLVLQDSQAVLDALKLHNASPKVALTDCLILALADRSGHRPLLTFDKDLAKSPGAKILT
jgi:predicted nucleic-acid-binding protein